MLPSQTLLLAETPQFTETPLLSETPLLAETCTEKHDWLQCFQLSPPLPGGSTQES